MCGTFSFETIYNPQCAGSINKRTQSRKNLAGFDRHNLELLTGQLVSEAAVAGDDLAQEILRKSAWALGVGIGNVANLVNPQFLSQVEA